MSEKVKIKVEVFDEAGKSMGEFDIEVSRETVLNSSGDFSPSKTVYSLLDCLNYI